MKSKDKDIVRDLDREAYCRYDLHRSQSNAHHVASFRDIHRKKVVILASIRVKKSRVKNNEVRPSVNRAKPAEL